jgi:uncharacterized protein (TIGR03067 family)
MGALVGRDRRQETPGRRHCELEAGAQGRGLYVHIQRADRQGNKGVDGPNKGKTILAIFEVNGDVLKVCYDVSGRKRPTEFQTKKGTALFLVHYKLKKS